MEIESKMLIDTLIINDKIYNNIEVVFTTFSGEIDKTCIGFPGVSESSVMQESVVKCLTQLEIKV